MKQLDPKAVWLFFISNSIRVLFISFFLFSWVIMGLSVDSNGYFNPAVFIPLLLLTIIVLLVITLVWSKLTYYFYRYELTDLGFKKESGVIYKKYVTIPYDRIQNVDIHRGLLARILGLSDLQIQTAGSSAVVTRYGVSGMGVEGRLPAISKETAEQVQSELLKRTTYNRNQGL